MEIYQIVYLVVGILIGAIISFLYFKLKSKSEDRSEGQINELNFQLESEKERTELLNQNITSVSDELKKERESVIELNSKNASLLANYKNLQEKLDNQKEEIEQIRTKFANEFKVMANEIFEEKGKKFADQNKVQIHDLLKPLGEKIISFEKRVEETNKESIARNSALKEQITGFKELNEKITKEAENLVKALKGDTKAQGNWGEYILESILEKSGLEKEREYFVQQSLMDDDGKRYQPDVIVKLPDNKNIIIDSKVSLIAYERFVNEDNTEEKEAHAKAHLLSIRTHLKGLSEKNYQNLYGIEGLDFVIMFIPIEPAFSLAIQTDADLFNEAYSKNIVLVSPTTLIATLRTIHSIWKQEYQNRNAIEIANEGGKMYDKFQAFVEDVKKIGVQLNTTQKTYQDAAKKLYEGTGNLVNRAEKMKKLGAKATKHIDQNLVDRALNE